VSTPLRVAIIGASGIGRHHANWHSAVGSHVVAFVGTTPERCQETARVLASTFEFSGRGYSSIDDMLRQERPDVVDICSPNHTHYPTALRALEAGCHVLCEKPMVWDPALTGHQMMDQVKHLQEAASASSRHLGMCSQLTAVLPQYERFCPDAGPVPSHFTARLETTSSEPMRSAAEVWVDMGPHPISLILARFPGAVVDSETLDIDFDRHTAHVVFEVVDGNHRCFCDITVCDKQPPLHRHFGFDGQIVEISGRPGDDGYYRAVLSRDGVEDQGTDPMHLLIRQFAQVVAGEDQAPLVSVDTALRNLQIQLGVIQRT
jgi:hypothetical protein